MTPEASVGMQPNDWIAILVGLAAFAAAMWSNYIAHRALRAGGRQKMAEFRKEWIESLRADIAEVLAQDTFMINSQNQLAALKKITKEKSKIGNIDFNNEAVNVIKAREKAITDRLRAFGSVLLKLNSEDGPNGELISVLYELMKDKNQPKRQENVVAAARVVFKSEWKKLSTELEIER